MIEDFIEFKMWGVRVTAPCYSSETSIRKAPQKPLTVSCAIHYPSSWQMCSSNYDHLFSSVCVWEHFWNTWCCNTQRKSPLWHNGGKIKCVLSCHVKIYDIHTKMGIYFLCVCISAFCCYWWMGKDKCTIEGGNNSRDGSWLLISHPANPYELPKPWTSGCGEDRRW